MQKDLKLRNLWWLIVGNITLLPYGGKVDALQHGSEIKVSEVAKIPLGEVIYIFPRYGYFSLSTRVVYRNDSISSWIFLEPSRPIFDKEAFKSTFYTFFDPKMKRYHLEREFHIDLCESANQLLEAYFKSFTIEGLERPWMAYSGGWRAPSMSKYFGIDPLFIVENYKYMLVKVMLPTKLGMVKMNKPPLKVISFYRKYFDHLKVNNTRKISEFFEKVGTHYVDSYITGNSLYQVFVYDDEGFSAIKQKLGEIGWNQRNKTSVKHFAQMPHIMPLWMTYVGKLSVLNAKHEEITKIQNLLTVPLHNTTIPNIFKLYNNESLIQELERTLSEENQGLLGLHLKTIENAFENNEQKEWFKAHLMQLMELWETNFN